MLCKSGVQTKERTGGDEGGERKISATTDAGA